MITVSFSYENGVRELVCSGHAGYDPGNDVVCAAASAITGTLAAVLLKREGSLAPSEEGAGKRDCKERLTEGEITPPAAATPHPSQLALQAETPSPQGEGLTDAQREVGGPSSPEAPRDDRGADTADMFNVSEAAGYCRITCAGDAAKPYFEFALVGLKKLAEAFPENVRVVGRE